MKLVASATPLNTSLLHAVACSALLAFTVPALAATGDSSSSMMMHHHHHHRMHGGMHSGRMEKSNGGDAETARLNDQSLSAAKNNMAPAMGNGAMTPAMGNGGAMSADHGTGAMTAPGTGMMHHPQGSMGTMAPATAPSMGTMAPANAPSTTMPPSNTAPPQ